MGAIIWQKPTTMNTTGGATVMGSFPYPRNGIIKIDYEFILIFKKPGDSPKVSKEIKEQSKLSKEEWNEYFSGHWNFNGEKQIQHLAMFPEELPKRLIKMFSFVGDTVLDPFLGSGTTILAAKNLNRNSVGYEINSEFLPIIKEKVGINQLSTLAKFEVFTQQLCNRDWEAKLQKLPYIFHDPIKFDKKIDPKRMSFGSKIDQSTPKRDEYFSVRKIINPELLVLSNNVKVRLLGVKTKQDTAQDAIKALEAKLTNQKIFLRFDDLKYDNNGNLLCYLYLKKKTFINAYLIKNRLVEVDTNFDFRYKERFLKLGTE
jgi:site-specific DNA-methyltransferase (adenine-specific)